MIALCAYPFFLSSAYKDDDTQILNLLVKMTSRYDGHHRAIHMMRNAQNYKEVDLILLIRVKGLENNILTYKIYTWRLVHV